MRIVFGVLSLLVVAAVVGLIAHKQLQGLATPAPGTAGGVESATRASGTPAQQSRQLQQQVRDDVNRLMQQAPARAEPTP